MNYYPFNVGDYASHTAHLEPMEDLAYRRMLDLYYRTEKPLPASVEDIARLIRLRDHAAYIRDVLNEFFTLTAEGWRHDRCDAELSKMQDKQAKARASAQASVNARSANAQRTLSERSADVELPTPTPTPTPREIHNPPTPSGVAPPKVRGSKRCPESFAIDADTARSMRDECPGVDIDAETRKFRDHTFATARTDWLATWRNWIRGAAERLPQARASPQRATAAALAMAAANPSIAAPHLRQPRFEVFDVTARQVD